MSRSPLGVGVMLDTPRVPAWVAWILTEIEKRDALSLELVALRGEAPGSGGLFSLYEALDRRAFAVEPDALATVDVTPLVAARIGDITARELDVLLWLASGEPGAAALAVPRHGVWRYRHGGEPPLFRELSSGAAVAETVLEVVGGDVIYRSVSATDAVSLHRNRVPVHWKSARFAVRRLEELASGCWRPGAARSARAPARSGGAPSGIETLRHVGRIAGRVARRKLRTAVFQHQWFLGFRRREGDRLPHEDARPWLDVVPPPSESYADPFVISHGADTFVFFELLEHASGRGRLAVGRLEADGRLTAIEPVLPRDHHTSYPYVFGDAGRMFLVPETGDARKVELFAATGFPTEWERVATLIDGVNAVDATVHLHEGRYWMWVTIAVPGGRLQDETFLYWSDRLDGGWTPHARNPVVSDARRARPAGRPFVHRGRLVRPSQNCAGRYGERVVFNEVEVLTPEDYRERACGSLGPDWAGRRNLAAHTYTFDGAWEATDGLRTFRRGAPGTATRSG